MSRAEQPESQAQVTVGQQLRTAREAAGVSAEVFAREANLTVRQLQAMETDEYSWFNGPVFVKGYIRVYAKRFGLNGDALIQQYEQANPEEQPKGSSVPMRPQPLRPSHDFKFRQPNRTQRSLKWLLLAVVVLIIIGLGVLLAQSNWFERDSAVATADVAANDVDQVSAVETGEAQMSLSTVVDGAPLQEGAVGVADANVDLQAEQAAKQLQQGAVAETVQATAQASPAEESAVAPVDASAAATAVEPVIDPANAAIVPSTEQALTEAALADDEIEKLLRLEFSDECWVQVKNAAGRVIHERIHKAGDAVDLDIVPPVQLWFGRARAVNVTYNGTAVALPLKAGVNSVKFTFTDAQGQSTLE